MSVTISIINERKVTFWGKPTFYLSTFTASTKKRLDSNFIHLGFRFNITFHISLVFLFDKFLSIMNIHSFDRT